jgi:phosphotransferase system enzyme I (PtsI)
MFRLIGHVIRSFNAENKSSGVCGEMGGNPLTAAVLMGLGMRTLSMGIASVPAIKKLITNVTIPELEKLAATVVNLNTAAEVEEYLKKELAHVL